MGRRIEDK